MSETKEEPITVRALRGNRTLTSFRTVAFEATAYTNSATKAKQEPPQRLRQLFLLLGRSAEN